MTKEEMEEIRQEYFAAGVTATVAAAEAEAAVTATAKASTARAAVTADAYEYALKKYREALKEFNNK